MKKWCVAFKESHLYYEMCDQTLMPYSKIIQYYSCPGFYFAMGGFLSFKTT